MTTETERVAALDARRLLVTVEGCPPYTTTQGEFLRDNEDPSMLTLVLRGARVGERVRLGGGAAPEVTVEVMP